MLLFPPSEGNPEKLPLQPEGLNGLQEEGELFGIPKELRRYYGFITHSTSFLVWLPLEHPVFGAPQTNSPCHIPSQGILRLRRAVVVLLLQCYGSQALPGNFQFHYDYSMLGVCFVSRGSKPRSTKTNQNLVFADLSNVSCCAIPRHLLCILRFPAYPVTPAAYPETSCVSCYSCATCYVFWDVLCILLFSRHLLCILRFPALPEMPNVSCYSYAT